MAKGGGGKDGDLQVGEDTDARRLLGHLDAEEAVGVPLVRIFAPNLGKPRQIDAEHVNLGTNDEQEQY